jgi:hypothetical protein
VAKEAELIVRSVNVVEALTSTVQAASLLPAIVKLPDEPDVPQVPAVAEPFTDPTLPNTRGILTATLVAVIESVPESCPATVASSPTQALAKEAEWTPGS